VTKNEKETIVTKLLKYHIAGLCVIGILLAILYGALDAQMNMLFANLENVSGFAVFDVLEVQISVSFIVISIITIFAQKTITVYWEDIIYYKLVNPRVTNINAMASYLFADLIISVILVLCSNKYVYITFFISIFLIMVLSLKIIAAFFSGELIRKELEKAFDRDKANRLTDKKARYNYREHKRKLIQYTIQAIDTNEIDTVCENMKFLYHFDEDEDITYLILKMLDDKKVYMLSRVAKVCQFIFGETEYLEQYDKICIGLLNENSKEIHGYIKSIYKSMGEFITENGASNLEDFKKIEKQFCEECKKLGHENLAREIEENFEGQLNRM